LQELDCLSDKLDHAFAPAMNHAGKRDARKTAQDRARLELKEHPPAQPTARNLAAGPPAQVRVPALSTLRLAAADSSIF